MSASPAIVSKSEEFTPSFDPRSLAGLTPEFAFHEALHKAVMQDALMERFHVSVVSGGEVERSARTGRVPDFMVRTAGGVVVVGEVKVTVIEALRGSRREPERVLSPEASALLARIDARRERLRREHGTFPNSGDIIRELRDRGEE